MQHIPEHPTTIRDPKQIPNQVPRITEQMLENSCFFTNSRYLMLCFAGNPSRLYSLEADGSACNDYAIMDAGFSGQAACYCSEHNVVYCYDTATARVAQWRMPTIPMHDVKNWLQPAPVLLSNQPQVPSEQVVVCELWDL